ncbi:chaperone modulator CbpM [Actinopolymorpha alba]|uniref:chaperone modulator CbpM n=1 Tax=Actinopolymorpha alba TaxID=533267 RepID=UPI00035CC7F9|nr:chaperone modulator CbpM [Actinopolymorpha alba]
MTFSLVPTSRLDLDSFARRTGLHPDLVRRLVALGLIDVESDPVGRLAFAPSQIAVVARIQRLRTGFCLNYAAVGLVLDLLDRIAELEAAVRNPTAPTVRNPTAHTTRRIGGPPWTRTE